MFLESEKHTAVIHVFWGNNLHMNKPSMLYNYVSWYKLSPRGVGSTRTPWRWMEKITLFKVHLAV